MLRLRICGVGLVILLLMSFQVAGCARTSALKSWVGDYTFSEYAPPNQNRFYGLSIISEDGRSYSIVSIDGFQVVARLQAKVSGNATAIQITFDKYLPDNVQEHYAKGAVLLSLKKEGSRLLTIWGEIQPILRENVVSDGRVCFQAEPTRP